MPLLTVFTPVFNLEKYIDETIQSILSQSFSDFEYILIDDYSTDRSVEIIETYNDPRIRLIKNDSNQGISYNRNHALDQAKGKYIAMIDGDDIALPGRLLKQIKFLEKNNEYGIIGTEIVKIDINGDQLDDIVKYKIPNNEIPSRMLFNNYIATSSTMIRLEAIGEIRFKKEFIVAEDYEVWIRLIRNCKIGQIREPLTKYRIHNDSISIQKQQLMLDTEIIIIKQQLVELKCDLKEEEFQVFLDLSKEKLAPYYEKFGLINQTISKLFNANKSSKLFDENSFRSLLFRYWHVFYLNIKSNNSQLLKEIKQSGMYGLLDAQEKIKLNLKATLKFKSK
jgi:glycosyltransferase involved in cell wall biosynthesis